MPAGSVSGEGGPAAVAGAAAAGPKMAVGEGGARPSEWRRQGAAFAWTRSVLVLLSVVAGRRFPLYLKRKVLLPRPDPHAEVILSGMGAAGTASQQAVTSKPGFDE